MKKRCKYCGMEGMEFTYYTTNPKKPKHVILCYKHVATFSKENPSAETLVYKKSIKI